VLSCLVLIRNGELRHYGYAGSGFTEKGLKDAVDKMKPLFTDKCPFVNPPNIKEKIQWVQPKLVCEVEYAELGVASLKGNFSTLRPKICFGGNT
jgi:ATP-dependent DNA ligase